MINTFNNKLKIGEYVSADIDVNRDWVTYSEGGEDEKDYYRDVYSMETGCLIYSYGESCKIENYDELEQTVTLSNNNIDDNDFPAIFKISMDQFLADFC